MKQVVEGGNARRNISNNGVEMDEVLQHQWNNKLGLSPSFLMTNVFSFKDETLTLKKLFYITKSLEKWNPGVITFRR